jgi:hypothetical protein
MQIGFLTKILITAIMGCLVIGCGAKGGLYLMHSHSGLTAQHQLALTSIHPFTICSTT